MAQVFQDVPLISYFVMERALVEARYAMDNLTAVITAMRKTVVWLTTTNEIYSNSCINKIDIAWNNLNVHHDVDVAEA